MSQILREPLLKFDKLKIVLLSNELLIDNLHGVIVEVPCRFDSTCFFFFLD